MVKEMFKKMFFVLLISILLVSSLSACNKITATGPVFWPWTWTDQKATGCIGDAYKTPDGGQLVTSVDELSPDGKFLCTASNPDGPFSWKLVKTGDQKIGPSCSDSCGETSVETWDNTCKKQSEAVGVTMTPLKEGKFFACVYHGELADVTIPTGTLADVDLGGIHVATGPVDISGVPNLTLRPWRTGLISEACAQVANLTAYGQTQNPKFTASPLNFSCR